MFVITARAVALILVAVITLFHVPSATAAAELALPFVVQHNGGVRRVNAQHSSNNTMHELSAVHDVIFTGCVNLQYLVSVTTGITNDTLQGPFLLTVSLTEASLLIAGSSCVTCGDANKYAPLQSDAGSVQSAVGSPLQNPLVNRYGESSYWSGVAVTDSVTIGDVTLPAMTIGVIDESVRYMTPRACIAPATPRQLQQAHYSGTLGLGNSAAAATGTSAFMDAYVNATAAADMFALSNGLPEPADARAVTSAMNVTTTGAYAVMIESISIGRVAIAGAASFADSYQAIATDYAQIFLPPDVFSDVTDAISTSKYFIDYIEPRSGSSFWSGACIPALDRAIANYLLPPLSITFRTPDGTESDPIFINAIPGYISVVGEQADGHTTYGGDFWCPGLAPAQSLTQAQTNSPLPVSVQVPGSAPPTILGLAWLNQLHTVVDRKSQTIQFSYPKYYYEPEPLIASIASAPAVTAVATATSTAAATPSHVNVSSTNGSQQLTTSTSTPTSTPTLTTTTAKLATVAATTLSPLVIVTIPATKAAANSSAATATTSAAGSISVSAFTVALTVITATIIAML